MKLRNKKTGEVIESKELLTDEFIIDLFSTDYDSFCTKLHKIIEEWEDYKEPKDTNYWCIDSLGKIEFHSTVLDEIDGTPNNAMIRKIIGNYFDTREEAEKAVEKLKALARLKQYGFRFIDWELDMKTVADGKIWFDIGTNTEWDAERLLEIKPEAKKSLDLLFGGEE